MKRLFRPFDFSNLEQSFWNIIQVLAVSAIGFVVVVLLVAGWAIWHPPKVSRVNYAPYYTAEEYSRLIKQHGRQHVIIEEPGQVPYYYDAHGRKCKLM